MWPSALSALVGGGMGPITGGALVAGGVPVPELSWGLAICAVGTFISAESSEVVGMGVGGAVGGATGMESSFTGRARGGAGFVAS